MIFMLVLGWAFASFCLGCIVGGAVVIYLDGKDA